MSSEQEPQQTCCASVLPWKNARPFSVALCHGQHTHNFPVDEKLFLGGKLYCSTSVLNVGLDQRLQPQSLRKHPDK